MKAFLLSVVLFFIYYFIFYISSAKADVSSQPIYGGGQMPVSQGFISIDKKVANPQSQSIWVDNLTINDPKYKAESSINFQINLTNTGKTEIKRIDVKDVFPQFVSFISGSGIFDANTKTLSFEANNLKPKEHRTFLVVGKVVSNNQLPVDLGTICMVNQATATTTDSGTSQDNTLFCVQKDTLGTQVTKGEHQTGQYQSVRPSPESHGSGTVPPKGMHQTVRPKAKFPVFPPQNITTTPATGPEVLAVFSLIPIVILGFLLIKKSQLG